MKMSFNIKDDLALHLKEEAKKSDKSYCSLLSAILEKRYLPTDHDGHVAEDIKEQMHFIVLLLQDDDLPATKRELLQKEIEELWKMIKMQSRDG